MAGSSIELVRSRRLKPTTRSGGKGNRRIPGHTAVAKRGLRLAGGKIEPCREIVEICPVFRGYTAFTCAF